MSEANLSLPFIKRSTAFQADSGKQPESSSSSSNLPNPTLQGVDKNGKKKTCLCGDVHARSKCPHLFEWNRTASWKEDSAKKQLIDEKRTKPYIAKTLQTIRDQHTKETAAAAAPPQGSDVPRGATTFRVTGQHHQVSALPTALSTQSSHYALVNSFILDSGATDHVSNNRERFSHFETAKEGEAVQVIVS